MVQVATFSMWKYGFDSRWGDQAALAAKKTKMTALAVKKTETAAPAAGPPKAVQHRNMAQFWLERLSDMQEIGGSNPPVPTITGGSSTGEFKKRNPVWDFGSNDS